MVNFGLNSASILGIFLAVAGAGLYFMRSFRPELARDQDIFFAAVGLLCGFILLFQGWRLDPILQFGQFLLTGTTVFFAYEAIRLRAITRKEVIDKTRIVDDERTPSRVYRYDQEAELYDQDQLEPEEEVYSNRRLRGTVDSRNNRTARYEGDVRPSRSRGDSERERSSGSGDRSPKRRPRPTTNRSSERPVESWEADLDTGSSWDDKPTRNSRPRPSTRPDSSDVETEHKPRKRRPPQDRRSSSPSTNNMETTSSDYVDYQPIDPSEEEKDNKPGRFDY